jgi:hypothetical protein
MKLTLIPRALYTAWKVGHVDERVLFSSSRPTAPVIASLTSIPTRLSTLHLTIRSILLQTARPKKILLWLHEDLRSRIPPALQTLVGDVFEIRFVDTTCPYRKLVHTLALHPDEVIVTCDDDEIYDRHMIENLYRDHVAFPRDVIAHECREIRCDAEGKLRPYSEWTEQKARGVTSPRIMSIGYGGVLYPPRCLHGDVLRRDLFMALSPRNDDLWFKAMSYLNGTTTRRCSSPVPKPIGILGTQRVALKHTNVRGTGNLEQMQAICDHYGIRFGSST